MGIRATLLASNRRSVLLAASIPILLLIAYSHLLGWSASGADLGNLLFRPGTVPPPLAVAVGAFALWQRWARLRSLPGPAAPRGAAVFAVVGTGLFVWAHLTGNFRLLLPALAAHGLAIATAARGWAACRVSLLPASILLLGLPVPKPLEDEIVWQLQRGTASAASSLLVALGYDVTREGVILYHAPHSFHVIDGCSGLSGIAILTLIALIVRELFADAGARAWALVALAPPLGFALNALRVGYVAASPDPEALGEDHAIQGLAVLMIGTATLYALGRAIAPPLRDRVDDDRGNSSAASGFAWSAVAAGCAGLALLAWMLPRWPESASSAAMPLDFPEQKAGWSSAYVPIEPMFHGLLSGGASRRYQLPARPNRPPRVVDFFVGFDDASSSESFRMLCSKLAFPGPDWEVVERQRARIWLLDREVELAFSVRGHEHAVSYSWRPRDRGLWRESWRAWLSLDSTPFRRERPRAAVRLIAYATDDGQVARDRARRRLDRFVNDFHAELRSL